MRHIIFILLFFLGVTSSVAQNFEDYFEEKTLRLDYIFTGTATTEAVALDELNSLNVWAGKRNNLAKLARQGNGQIKVIDKASGKTIYREAFSSLFQEWQSTSEAQKLTKSFENIYLIPYPKQLIEVIVSFRMKDGNYKELLNHTVDPKDVLIHNRATKKEKANYLKIHDGGEVGASVNVVIVPEGYTEKEMDKFLKDANTTVEQIFAHTPFNKYKSKFNFYALQSPSKDSGVSIPSLQIWKKTLVSSHFDTFYSDRYLTTSRVKDLHNSLADVPYSHIIILANTKTYGGGGILNSYTLTTTGHADFKPVVVHEFGHSFAGLADEYFYEGGDILDTMYTLDVEPWEPNITTRIDFNSKWENMLEKNTPVPTPVAEAKKYPVGVFEGGGYMSQGIYRPADDCRMRTNTSRDFCPVCQRAIEEIIKHYTE